uniref:Uncharacterized protein n=1 Tax=Glyptapanteles indiensis TaxID=92994 RepID=B7S929_GLYIN|nr:conserved hypothetical protein [Glyptapanteles indiensis]
MSKHMCLVPYEWDHYYKSSIIEVILKKEITCDQISKKITGIGINVNGVTAHLHYWGELPWMKKKIDKKDWPNPNEYFSICMSCDNCRILRSVHCNAQQVTRSISVYERIIEKAMSHPHQVPCWIPREWLAFPWDALRVTISMEISQYYLRYGRPEGSAVRINGTTARLQVYNQTFWMRNDLDLQARPNLKSYYSFLIPCIYCSKL